MHKLFRALCVTLVLALTLSACALSSRRTLVLWHLLSGQQERALLTLVDQWNATNSAGFHIIAERREPLAQHSAMLDVIDAPASTQRPDLVLATPQQAAIYHQLGALQQLESFVEGPLGFKANDRADLFPFVLNAGKTPQGALIGIPHGGRARVMLANKRWLDSQSLLVPENWEQFERICERIAELAPELPCVGVVTDDVLVQEWLIAHGTRPQTIDGAAQLSAGEIQNVLEPLVTKRQNGQALLAVSNAQMRDAFAVGQLAFALDWSDDLAQIESLSRANDNADWVVAPVPAVSGVPASIQRAPLWVIPKQPVTKSNEGAAWAFVHWVLEQDQTARWAIATGELPARVSAINKLDSDRLPRGFLTVVQQVAARTQAEPLISTWPCVRETLANVAQELQTTEALTVTLATGQAQLQAQLIAECPVRGE